MLFDTCRFCEHVNPPDARFCNACGGPLHLLPCSSCGAVNDVTANTCYQCHSPLPGRGKAAPEVPQPLAGPPKALPRPHARIILGSAILAVLTLASYFGYRQASHLNAAQPTHASSRLDGRGIPDDTGVISRNAVASDMAPGKRDDGIQPVSTAAAQPRIPFAGAAPETASQPREGRQSEESRAARVATAPLARTKGTNEGRASEREQSRAVACTESVAALGLCTLKPAQTTGADVAVAIKPVIARSKAADAGRAGRQEGRRQDLCTEGATALGLCTPRPTQEGK
jgi:ribosomal protein L40E